MIQVYKFPVENPIQRFCPFCGHPVKFKLSGRGKHYGKICPSCGIVGIIRNPLCPYEVKKKNWFQRMMCAIFGVDR